MRERLTAIRAWISDIANGKYGDEDGPKVISPQGVELRRVKIQGQIVDKISGKDNFASITVDDGTETIRAKAWGAEAEALEQVSQDIWAMVIGKVRNYNDEIYIVPEIIKEIDDPNLMTLHHLERYRSILLMGDDSSKKSIDMEEIEQGPQKQKASKPAQQTITPRGLKGEILDFIRENDSPEGVPIQKIADHFQEQGVSKTSVNREIIELGANGTIAEQSVGVYRAADR